MCDDALVGTSHAVVEAEDEVGVKRVLGRIGAVAAAPVVIPARAATKKVERYAMNKILGSLIRHGLTTVGGAGFMASDSTVETLVTGIMTAVGAGWSLYKEYKAHQDSQQRITLPKP